MNSSKLFTEHPASVGETYGEQMVMATGFGVRMIAGGIACLMHGQLPFLFVKTVSNWIAQLHDTMVANRRRKPMLTGLDPVI